MEDYRFLPIADAIASIGQRVNLTGLVLETSIPKKSRGTDCFCILRIVDESYQSHGISVNFFAEDMKNLPLVKSAGDIIQLSRVVMKAYDKEVFAIFNKCFSTFALFEGKHSTNFTPYQVSKVCPRDKDVKFLVSLRKWSVHYQLDEGTNEFSSLKDIRVGEHLNLMCKVLYTCEVTEKESAIYIWDGTDTPPVTVSTKHEDPLPLQLEPFPLSRDILCTFPAVGTVLRVMVDQSNGKVGLEFLKSGRWVKWVNLTCELHNGLWRALLMPFTKLRYLPNDDPLVLQAQSYYDERVSSKWGRVSSRIPWSYQITEIDFQKKPCVTLMNVLTYPEVTAKFSCVVRVIAMLPWRADDFRSTDGTYRIRLILEDPTARIHAFVHAEDGERFFGGYPSVNAMTRMRNKLLGISESDDITEIQDVPRNPPWIRCCIKSYYLDRNDVWGSRNYRIFATKLLQ